MDEIVRVVTETLEGGGVGAGVSDGDAWSHDGRWWRARNTQGLQIFVLYTL